MDKEKIQQLHNELNELSENEEKNKERMLEIARVLVQIYLPNKKNMEEDIKSDLQDSLEILKADKFKQGRDYSQQVITDIEKVLNDLHSNENKNGGKDLHSM